MLLELRNNSISLSQCSWKYSKLYTYLDTFVKLTLIKPSHYTVLLLSDFSNRILKRCAGFFTSLCTDVILAPFSL